MPPMPFEYQGRDAAARFFAAISPAGGRDRRFVLTRANGQPACAIYVRDPTTGMWRALGVIVLTLAGDLISEITRFDNSVLGAFGLPRTLPEPGLNRLFAVIPVRPPPVLRLRADGAYLTDTDF